MNKEWTEFCRIKPDGTTESGSRECLLEHTLEIGVNEQTMYHLVCTKTDLKELVYGRLYTDRIIDQAQDVKLCVFCRTGHTASVFLNPEIEFCIIQDQELSCCSANHRYRDIEKKRELVPVKKTEPDWQKVFELTQLFQEDQGLHGNTKAVHKSILFYQKNGRWEHCSFEDIGRHNTIDKAAGYALLNEIELSECMLFTSGRVPLDMTEKVIAAGIPILISKSVPTVESIQMAKKYGLNLICRAWPDSCEVYA